MKSGNVVMYAPEQWGTLEKFSKFYSTTHTFSERGKRALSGAINHFHKAQTLRNLAFKILPNLELDDEELEKNGYTQAINSKELSAIVEAVILELYSSLDCTRKVITEIYTKVQGMPDSTRKYFQNIKNQKISNDFPEQLILAVKEATWFNEFRAIRDELTHHDTGTCSRDKETRKIQYFHYGIKVKGKPLIIEDIFEMIEQSFRNVNQFIGRVFAYLYSQLKDTPMLQYCGIFNGRMYTRVVSPSEAKDFNDGLCDAKKWFTLEENPTCIFANVCGAYKNSNN